MYAYLILAINFDLSINQSINHSTNLFEIKIKLDINNQKNMIQFDDRLSYGHHNSNSNNNLITTKMILID